MDEDKLKDFYNDILSSDNVVFFGGAGVSTASGIPDFRSAKGLYKTGKSSEEMLSYTYFITNPKEFYEYYFENIVYLEAKPNNCHILLAELEKKNILKAVVTQNIDNLHQMAGSKNVLELHGSIYRNYGIDSKKPYSLDYLIKQKDLDYPPQTEDGELIRPDVVLYGEMLNQDVMLKATRVIGKAEYLIIAGTSLAVYPAASLVNYFKGKKIYLLNKEPVGIFSTDDVSFIQGDVNLIAKGFLDYMKNKK